MWRRVLRMLLAGTTRLFWLASVLKDLGLVVTRLCRRTVGEHDHIRCRLVYQLDCGARLDNHEALRRQLNAFRWLPEQHGERSLDHTENLLLDRLDMAPSSSSGRKAPEVRLRMTKYRAAREFNDSTRRLVRVPTGWCKDLFLGSHHNVTHRLILTGVSGIAGGRTRTPPYWHQRQVARAADGRSQSPAGTSPICDREGPAITFFGK